MKDYAKITEIVVVFPIDESSRAKIESAVYGSRLTLSFRNDASPEALRNAEVVFGNPSPEQLRGADKLRWIQLCSAGADQYTGDVLPDGVCLTNASGAYGPSIGEYMICMAMNLMLDLPAYRDRQRLHQWDRSGKIRHIPGSVALSVGFGDIGREFAKRYHALGGQVIGVKRTPGIRPDYLDELHTSDDLDELLPRADVVALSLPSTDKTHHLFGRAEFAKMKKGALLINAGRGTAVDTDELNLALRAGKLGGAALDVTDPEPLPADHPLWDAPNTIITPHVAGGWNVPENFERIIEIFLDNLNRYLRGEPMKNRVNIARGY